MFSLSHLPAYQLGKFTGFFHQLLIGAFFYHTAVFQHYDPVKVFHSRQSVGNHHDGGIQLADVLKDPGLGDIIQRRGCFIQKQDSGMGWEQNAYSIRASYAERLHHFRCFASGSLLES